MENRRSALYYLVPRFATATFDLGLRLCAIVNLFCCGQSVPSRPLDNGGGGSLPKNFSRPFAPEFGLNIIGGGAPRASHLNPPLEIIIPNNHYFYSLTLRILIR